MEPSKNLGPIVLITGCSGGLGQLLAETLARKNYHVLAMMRAVDGRNANAAHGFRTLAERESLHLDVLELNVTDNASVEHAVDVVIAQADHIDILINNAGYLLLGLIEACTLEQAQRIFDSNFFGAVRMNRAVLPHMRRQGSGLLVHISSGASRVGIPGIGLYSATKFALEALAEAYRHELGLAVQKAVFGTMIEEIYKRSPKDQLHTQRSLSANWFGDYYTRTGIDIKVWELITLSILISLGGVESQIKGHTRGNLNVGSGRDVLLKVCVMVFE